MKTTATNAHRRDPGEGTIEAVCHRINSRWTPAERRCRFIMAVAKQIIFLDQLLGRATDVESPCVLSFPRRAAP